VASVVLAGMGSFMVVPELFGNIRSVEVTGFGGTGFGVRESVAVTMIGSGYGLASVMVTVG